MTHLKSSKPLHLLMTLQTPIQQKPWFIPCHSRLISQRASVRTWSKVRSGLERLTADNPLIGGPSDTTYIFLFRGVSVLGFIVGACLSKRVSRFLLHSWFFGTEKCRVFVSVSLKTFGWLFGAFFSVVGLNGMVFVFV